MRPRNAGVPVCLYIWAAVLGVTVAWGQTPGDSSKPTQPADTGSAATIEQSGFQQSFLQGLAKGPSTFPHVWLPYEQKYVPEPVLLNSPRLKSLIHDGKLELSLADALALDARK